ncbi:MAG: electron transport complex subunit RsxC [Paludibacter sp.]|jgi:electron transport complex protein RnfC|nr:electron transport complex subunit RsxC [Paludibacter sp.]
MHTFRIGGIHPKENKLSAGKTIIRAEIPPQVVISLSNHTGAPAKAVVEKGDTVRVGQIIGEANGFISANVHSSVSGKVSKIDSQPDVSGRKQLAVFIDVEGDEWLETIDRSPDIISQCNFTKEEILAKIKNAGIVGLGGATFPAHVKLSPPPDKKANILIINGVECEPYLTCDHALMLCHADEILIGVTIIMKVLDVKRAVIGIENNKKDVIAHLSKLAKNYQGIEIQALKTKYPQGGEKQLIDAVIRRQVPSGKLPIEVGAVVQNVATVFAIYQAVQKNKPLFERVMTITGKDAQNPGNYLVRIGVNLSAIVAQAGGIPETTEKIIAGGPMMGRAVASLDTPAVKGSAGILFINNEQAQRKEAANCIRCSKCVNACPMGLEPYLLMTQSENSLWDKMETNHVMDCMECGCCSYVCPSNRPILDYVRYGKTTVGGIIRGRK